MQDICRVYTTTKLPGRRKPTPEMASWWSSLLQVIFCFSINIYFEVIHSRQSKHKLSAISEVQFDYPEYLFLLSCSGVLCLGYDLRDGCMGNNLPGIAVPRSDYPSPFNSSVLARTSKFTIYTAHYAEWVGLSLDHKVSPD